MQQFSTILIFVILLLGCNTNMQEQEKVQEQKKEPEVALPVKPCSREEVKETVLSLFKAEIDSTETEYELNRNGERTEIHNPSQDVIDLKQDVVKDSIDNIFSTPSNETTCNCEATIYYTVREKIYKRLYWHDSNGNPLYTGDWREVHDDWEKPHSYKEDVKYDVKTSDDGKTYVELYK
jgi:hypothetical protein